MTDKQKAATIDRYGELDAWIAGYQLIVSEHKELEKIIAGWFDARPTERCVADGAIFQIQVGPRGKKRKITRMRALYRFLGVQKFLEWCSFPLEALDKLADEPTKYVEVTQTGPRKVVAIALKALAVAPAAKAA